MGELIAVWRFLQELGQVSILAIAVALYFIWRNDLKHIGADVAEVKKDLKDHLRWHSEQGGK